MSARFAIALLALAGCTGPPAPEATPAAAAIARPDMEKTCAGAKQYEWDAPGPPVHIFGNVYHAGTCTITVLLLTTPEGHVLIDGAVGKAVPGIVENIRKLGFDPHDVKWIVSSHEHYDHADGLAALKAATGAKLAANKAEVAALESAQVYAEDPQRGMIGASTPVKVDRAMSDGETLAVGKLVLTMHATPAHAPGSTSWTWTSCEGSDCKRVAYMDSVSTPAADDYRFADHPVYVAGVRAALGKMAGIDCQLLLTPHPGQSAMYERYAGKQPLAAPGACADYARKGLAAFDQRIADEARGG